MAKSLEALSEVVTNQKHPFRKVDNQPKKPLKHRYERRKIKEYLHLGDWISGDSAEANYPMSGDSLFAARQAAHR